MKTFIFLAFFIVASLTGTLAVGIFPNKETRDPTIWIDPVTNMEFVLIPSGCATFGYSEAEKKQLHEDIPPEHVQRLFGLDLPQYETCVEAFWLSRHEVTQKTWEQIMGDEFHGCAKGENLPATFVSWNEVSEFMERLNALHNDSFHFRLPTEDEWEYACRAGTDTPFHTGETISSDQANYKAIYTYGEGQKGQYRGAPIAVGSFPDNDFGLFDMHGNVMEWTSSSGHDLRYTPKELHVLRGGSYQDRPQYLRCASRVMAVPLWGNCRVGFRLARDQ
jgi:formylglycine-generating enzyme required for sulfatase activity